MACPFFTTIKMITALMILVFSFMQIMSIRNKWQTKTKSSKEEEEINEKKKNLEENSGPIPQISNTHTELS